MIAAHALGLVAALTGFAALAGQRISLDGAWTLDYFPQPDAGAVRSLPIPAHRTVEAVVPGNCELDLIRAGVLPEPETGMNVLKLHGFEGHQWLYTKSFAAPGVPRDGSRAELVFGGIDTLADVFLNGEKIGESANMLIERRFDVTGRLNPGTNVVQVLIRSAAIEAQFKGVGEIGYSLGVGGLADGEPFRKAAHMGGWDIFPRVYASGLWRPVALEIEGPVRIDETAWIVSTLDSTNRSARLDVRCRVQAPFSLLRRGTVRYSLSRDGRRVAERTEPLNGYLNGICDWVVGDLDFWWPRGMGRQPLYEAVIEIVDGSGAVLGRRAERIGIRTVALERDDVYGPSRPGQFLFRINGEPCYIRGSNWVPTDAFPSRSAARMTGTLELFRDLNCNLVRVWGGGVYEPDAFFDWCDANGMMVWQDFMTGCSVFPQDDGYAAATREEVRSVVLRLRNRASLVLWCGNNENDEAFDWRTPPEFRRDPNRERTSRQTIPDVLFDCDITRPYLPSSPYRSPDVVSGCAEPSERHLWGERAYYKEPYYTNSVCWFASEMGYHGCPNVASLKRMMTSAGLYPWSKVVSDDPWTGYLWNDEWLLKASDPFLSRTFGQRRNSLMTNQVRLMFGEVPTNLTDFVEASQIVQSEAMKTFVELFRSQKFTKKNGLVWWNVRDGWPQVSDAVVDYYGGRKRAYETLKTAQREQLVVICDNRGVYALNETRGPVMGRVRISDRESGKVVLTCSYDVPANAAAKIGEVSWRGQGVLDIDYEQGGERGRNWFLYGEIPFGLSQVRKWLDDKREDE